MSTLFFLFGALLVLIGTIGGGFEVQQLKIPRVSMFSRLLTSGVGIVLMLLSIGLAVVDSSNPEPSAIAEAPKGGEPLPTPMPVPEPNRAPGLPAPDSLPSTIDPGDDHTSAELQQAVAAFILLADQAEIVALEKGDPSYLIPLYHGDALDGLTRGIHANNQAGVVQIARVDTELSYIADLRIIDDHLLSVDACEYWEHAILDLQSGALVDYMPLTLMPQTITIELINGEPFITSIAFHEGPVFCAEMASPA